MEGDYIWGSEVSLIAFLGYKRAKEDDWCVSTILSCQIQLLQNLTVNERSFQTGPVLSGIFRDQRHRSSDVFPFQAYFSLKVIMGDKDKYTCTYSLTHTYDPNVEIFNWIYRKRQASMFCLDWFCLILLRLSGQPPVKKHLFFLSFLKLHLHNRIFSAVKTRLWNLQENEWNLKIWSWVR